MKKTIEFLSALLLVFVVSSFPKIQAQETPASKECNALYEDVQRINISIKAPFKSELKEKILNTASRISSNYLSDISNYGLAISYDEDSDPLQESEIKVVANYAVAEGNQIEPEIDENIIIGWLEIQRINYETKAIRKYEYTPISRKIRNMSHIPLGSKLVSDTHRVSCAVLWNSYQVKCTEPGNPKLNKYEKSSIECN